jgi:uncharacterized membrane protein
MRKLLNQISPPAIGILIACGIYFLIKKQVMGSATSQELSKLDRIFNMDVIAFGIVATAIVMTHLPNFFKKSKSEHGGITFKEIFLLLLVFSGSAFIYGVANNYIHQQKQTVTDYSPLSSRYGLVSTPKKPADKRDAKRK